MDISEVRTKKNWQFFTSFIWIRFVRIKVNANVTLSIWNGSIHIIFSTRHRQKHYTLHQHIHVKYYTHALPHPRSPLSLLLFPMSCIYLVCTTIALLFTYSIQCCHLEYPHFTCAYTAHTYAYFSIRNIHRHELKPWLTAEKKGRNWWKTKEGGQEVIAENKQEVTFARDER